jgi:hypothetical protein
MAQDEKNAGPKNVSASPAGASPPAPGEMALPTALPTESDVVEVRVRMTVAERKLLRLIAQRRETTVRALLHEAVAALLRSGEAP